MAIKISISSMNDWIGWSIAGHRWLCMWLWFVSSVVSNFIFSNSIANCSFFDCACISIVCYRARARSDQTLCITPCSNILICSVALAKIDACSTCANQEALRIWSSETAELYTADRSFRSIRVNRTYMHLRVQGSQRHDLRQSVESYLSVKQKVRLPWSARKSLSIRMTHRGCA